jgi:hypothetical protein
MEEITVDNNNVVVAAETVKPPAAPAPEPTAADQAAQMRALQAYHHMQNTRFLSA